MTPASRHASRPAGRLRRASARAAFAGAALLAVLGQAAADPAAEPDADFRFEGAVEPLASVTVANRTTGVIETIGFQGGEHVMPGTLLATMDDDAEQIAVEAARAAVEEAAARLSLAQDAAARAAALLSRGTGSQVDATTTKGESRIAAAALARAQSELAAAELALSRTRITAPIEGTVGRPLVAPGAFVEAETGAAIAEIVTVDPVLIAYGVPYRARQQAMATTGASEPHAMFRRLRIRLVLPDGTAYPHHGRPRFESGRIDPATGVLTSWGEVPNPDGVLVPGLAVEVLSWLVAAPAGEADAPPGPYRTDTR